MENASKALIIAGGILLGMLTISVFYFMFSRLSEYQSIAQTDYTQEELIAFNQGFESYNKKLMYGSDVISVINKAVDNNIKHNVVNEPTNEHYMDISVKLKEPLYMRIDTYKRNPNGTYDKEGTRTKTIFKAGSAREDLKSFQISNSEQYENIKKYIIEGANMTDEEGNTIVQSRNPMPEYNSNKSKYTITYYPVTEFKRLTFRCSKANYDKVSGRIKYMEFTQYTK